MGEVTLDRAGGGIWIWLRYIVYSYELFKEKRNKIKEFLSWDIWARVVCPQEINEQEMKNALRGAAPLTMLSKEKSVCLEKITARTHIT